jgi:putative ABC transport system permease protein
MGYSLLIFKSAFRNRIRALLTAGGTAIAIVMFLFMRTFISAWYAGVEGAQNDRLIVRNKISITFPLPLSYVDKVRDLVGDGGVVSWNSWFGGVYPKDEHGFFASLAADDEGFKLYPEFIIKPDEMKAYLEDRTGAIVGVHLAEKYGWKIGDKVTLRGAIYPGDWDFTVRGIYDSRSRNVDTSTFFFHWKYLNERVDERLKNFVGIIAMRITDPGRSTALATAIDHLFANSLAETRTESEKAFQLEFLSMLSTIILALQVVSIVVLLLVLLILVNTMAMSTRERTTEYAVMRAMGFRPRHIIAMVLGEGFVIAAVGAAVGVLLAAPVLRYVGQLLEKAMGGFIGDFGMQLQPVVLSIAAALVLGMLAAAIPAWRAGRLNIVDALRRVE